VAGVQVVGVIELRVKGTVAIMDKQELATTGQAEDQLRAVV
jgi:hypothetical protein